MSSTINGQCYWENLMLAQAKCSIWSACKYIYQSDKHSPATTGNPVYWPRGHGDVISEKGAILWKQQGDFKYRHRPIPILF